MPWPVACKPSPGLTGGGEAVDSTNLWVLTQTLHGGPIKKVTGVAPPCRRRAETDPLATGWD